MPKRRNRKGRLYRKSLRAQVMAQSNLYHILLSARPGEIPHLWQQALNAGLRSLGSLSKVSTSPAPSVIYQRVLDIKNITQSAISRVLVSAIPNFDYFASPNGTGNGTFSSPFRISDFWAVAGPGVSLGLLDGTYTGANSMIVPSVGVNGSSGNPVVIRAVNDGGAAINGEHARVPIDVVNSNDYITIQGVNAYNSSGSVITVHGGSTNIQIKRCIAWDADSTVNVHTVNANNCSNVLFEDVAVFGEGRNNFAATSSGNNITLRRCWAQWETQLVNNGPEGNVEGIYNSSGLTIENCVFTWADATSSLQAYGTVQVGHGGGGTGLKVLGCILYVKNSSDYTPGQVCFVSNLVTSGAELRNVCVFLDTSWTGKVPYDLGNTTGGVKNHCTEIGGTSSITGSGWTSTENSDVADIVSAPNLWTNTGNGARVWFRYVDGTLTSDTLWPWPMDARIRAALTIAGKNPDTIFGGSGNGVTQQMEAIFGAMP
jgi:hypothetical protein